MTSLILSQEASHPSHKRHVPATHSTDFVPLNEEYTAKAKTLTTEMLEGIPIKQLTQAAREMALALVQSMPKIFPTYWRLNSLIEWWAWRLCVGPLV